MAKNIVGRSSANRTGDEDREECERNLQDSESDSFERSGLVGCSLLSPLKSSQTSITSTPSPSATMLHQSTAQKTKEDGQINGNQLSEYAGLGPDELKEIQASILFDIQKKSANCQIISTNLLQAPPSSPAKPVAPSLQPGLLSPAKSVASSSAASSPAGNKTTSQVPTPIFPYSEICWFTFSVQKTCNSPTPIFPYEICWFTFSVQFLADKKKQTDDIRNKIHMQLKELETLCPRSRKCNAFEEVKKFKTEYDVLSRNTKDAEIRLKLSESNRDEVIAIWNRRSLLLQQLQLLG